MTQELTHQLNWRKYKKSPSYLSYVKRAKVEIENNDGLTEVEKKVFKLLDSIQQTIFQGMKWTNILYSFNLNEFEDYFLHENKIKNIHLHHDTQCDLLTSVQEQMEIPFEFFLLGKPSAHYNLKPISLNEIGRLLKQVIVQNGFGDDVFSEVMYSFYDYVEKYESMEQDAVIALYSAHESFAFHNIKKHLKKDIEMTNRLPLNKYRLAVENIVTKHDEVRGKVSTFVPHGECYRDYKVTINTAIFPQIPKYGRPFDITYTRIVFWHELGHSIHFLKPSQFLKPAALIENSNAEERNGIIKMDSFILGVKKSYQFSKKLNLRQKKITGYYVAPKGCDWDRPSEESFAESFSVLMNLFMHGLTSEKEFILNAKNSNLRMMHKVLAPSVEYLFKNIDWVKIGVPQHLYLKRKPLIKKYLAHLKRLPVTLSDETSKYTSGKSYHLTKPNVRQLKG